MNADFTDMVRFRFRTTPTLFRELGRRGLLERRVRLRKWQRVFDGNPKEIIVTGCGHKGCLEAWECGCMFGCGDCKGGKNLRCTRCGAKFREGEVVGSVTSVKVAE